jgi:hypothetical protein
MRTKDRIIKPLMRYAVETNVPPVQAVMPEELVHQSRTAGPREEEPDAKGRYP